MYRLLFLLIVIATVLPVSAQIVLFEDDFNTCNGLSSDWTVSINGNQNFVWYVGMPHNPKCDSTSIDGTCMLVLDDDATGNNTPAFVADFKTPEFDGRGFATVLLEVDVNYRDLGNLDEYFEILLSDGTNERILARYDAKNPTGAQFSQHISFSSDLSLYGQNDKMQIIFRYDDAGGYAWWAGIDNVKITGIGEGSPVVVETFDSCALPMGWSSEVVTGDYDWYYTPPPSPRYSAGSSMNGSCFVLFDDDYIGQTAKPSLLRLASPWFDGREYATFQLSFELIFRWYISETFSVYVENGNGERSLVASWPGTVGGPNFSSFVRQSFDLSAFRSPQMRVVFEFDDGGSWGWWVGLDNVKISGHGEAHDVCSRAIDLTTGAACLAGENKTAMFDGPVPSCSDVNSSGIWYRWVADTSGWMEVFVHADFNDVVSIFTGDCSSLNWVTCGNRDKYGFTGEKTYFEAQQGTPYLIRVSGGMSEQFGIQRGDFCIKINPNIAPPQPELNDLCTNAIPIIIGDSCRPGNNLNALSQSPYPARNLRADADVWYTFTAPALAADEMLRIESSAVFSDVITLYEGSCQSSFEVKGTELGQRLDIEHLTPGQMYYIQLAGNFATIEGGFCIEAHVVPKATPPANDDCVQATNLFPGTDCTYGSLRGATFSGMQAPCVVSTQRDAWYSFIAPPEESIQVIVDADFKHNTTIWDGTCGNLSAVQCLKNPLSCEGYQKITGLIAGETYYIQISSTGQEQGDFCIRIIDGHTAAPFDPLRLSVQNFCIGVDSSLLLIHAYNGLPPYTWSGNEAQQLLLSGEEYLVVVRDAMGCEKSIAGIAPSCDDAANCTLDIQWSTTDPTCADGHNGSINVSPTNGDGPFIYVWSVPNQITSTAENLGSGIYSVTVYDAHGCSAIGAAILHAPPAISITVINITDPTGGETNGSIETSFTGGSGTLTAAWYDKDGMVLSNTASLFNVGSGQYTLVVTDSNGCTASQAVTLQVISSTHPIEKTDLVQLVPNPAKGKAFILLDKSLQGPCTIEISDPSGRIAQNRHEVDIHQGQVALDISNFPAGTYFVRIEVDHKFFTKRLLVVKN